VKDAATLLYERFLILRCQTGDEAALGELIARYSPGLRLFLRKMTGKTTTVDDLLQETWFAVYRKINALQHPEAFTAWLYRIARDKAYRELRRKPAPRMSLDDTLPESIASKEESFTFDEIENVREALDKLPLEQREVLVLRFIEEMTYEHIADVIACPVGTVRSRIHYAKRALRAKLELTTLKKEVQS
jgi:RNA polymerase sigma-70 factor, ECF subfamily